MPPELRQSTTASTGQNAQRFASRAPLQSATAGTAQAIRQAPFVVLPANQHFAHRAGLEHGEQRLFVNTLTP